MAVGLLAVLMFSGCATGPLPAGEAESPALMEQQQLANSLQRLLDMPPIFLRGPWTPNGYVAYYKAREIWQPGTTVKGGWELWLRSDVIGIPCGQYLVSFVMTKLDHLRPKNPLKAQLRPDYTGEAIQHLVSVGWTEQAAKGAMASCPEGWTVSGTGRLL